MKKYADESRPKVSSSRERVGYDETGIGLNSGLDFATYETKQSSLSRVHRVCMRRTEDHCAT